MSKAEEFIKDNTKDCSNVSLHIGEYYEWVSPLQAREAVKIAKEETIKEVCEWIKYNNENGGCLFDGWENDLKKYLEDKV